MASETTSEPLPDAARRDVLITVLRWSLAVAVLTIVLKLVAWLLTGSVGLLSDAAESVVNVVAAGVALVAVGVASRPPDEDHAYGHDKADYFSAGFEGGLILLAAGSIAYVSILRLIDPQPIERVEIGLAVTAVAALINFMMARHLMKTGREQDSIVLTADGRHLMTDVWTSAGVIAGVALVVVTGWERLDPIIALLVAVNIVWTGGQLVKRSASGLMDRALEPAELARINAVLESFTSDQVHFHALRTRRSGRRVFISTHVLVPGEWTVQRGHNLVEIVEAALAAAFSGPATVFTHLEPAEDPVSQHDRGLDRRTQS